MTFMWPCGGNLEYIRLKTKKTNKQTNKSWTDRGNVFYFPWILRIETINKFQFQGFGVYVEKKTFNFFSDCIKNSRRKENKKIHDFFFNMYIAFKATFSSVILSQQHTSVSAEKNPKLYNYFQ